MTPAARFAAAIDVLDAHLGGVALERALTGWARGARYAGSKDRAAVRDIVFQCMRCRDSYVALGGVRSGRGLVFGYILCDGGVGPVDGGMERIAAVFTGERHAPGTLSDVEIQRLSDATFDATIPDMPSWLIPEFEQSLCADFPAICQALKTRAPVFVRVNLARNSREQVQDILAEGEIESQAHPLAKAALEIISNPRRIAQSRAYKDGLIELQDAASQAVIETLPEAGFTTILDYCAGGGGKTLALADRFPGARLFAHDAEPARMADLPDRAARAGVDIRCLTTPQTVENRPFDLVLCDVPCSGSGAWRRAVEGKWLLTSERFEALRKTQAEILAKAAALVRPGGYLVYVTCSMLQSENTKQIQKFTARNSNFSPEFERQFTPLDGGDGFYVALLRART